MKNFFSLLVLCLISICAIAQETKDLKQVKLKSGIVLSGYVTNNTDGTISVTTIDGDQLWYSPNEIQSVTDDPTAIEARRKAEAEAKAKAEADKKRAQEEAEQAKAKALAEAKAAKKAEKDAIKMKEKGFQLLAEVGCDNEEFGTITLIPSYRFNHHFLLGLGVGIIDSYWNIDDVFYRSANGLSRCFLIKALYMFKEKPVTPFLGLNYGYLYYPELEIIDGNWKREKAEEIDSYCLSGDIGAMLRSRRGRGLYVSISLNYWPAPNSIHGVLMDDCYSIGGKIGLIF